MTIKEILESICDGLQDFSKTMTAMTDEMNEDFKKSDIQREKRAIKDKENLEKLWGKKK